MATAWREASEEHQRALLEVVQTGRALEDGSWEARREAEGWSPAQVVEHLALTYEAVLREIRGGEGVRLRAVGLRQRIFRWFVLPHILFHRSIPVRVRAPREARPAEGPYPRPESLQRLESLGGTLLREMEQAAAAGGGSLTHPYFGRIPPVRALRFLTVHLEHHHRQIRTIAGL